ncbi:MAG: ribonuclease P protein component [Methylococcales bacterium]|jgi:ribonuclease P protein component|nr:ribonuclease P protein component [Methylococcales bacterium]MBT7411311.1 ribonuclease P protein component [Methylococcales bacterium]
MISNKFTRKIRLVEAQDYKFVFSRANKISDRNFTLLARKNSLDHPRLGLAIAKKNIKKSVQRNRIKRLIRETFRQSQNDLSQIDVVVMASKKSFLQSNTELLTSLNSLWQKLFK